MLDVRPKKSTSKSIVMHLIHFLIQIKGLLMGSFFSLKCLCKRCLQHAPSSEYAQLILPFFTLNKNFNTAVAEPPLTGNDLTNFFSTNQHRPYFSLCNFPEAGSSMKQIFFDEKPNYYPRLGQSNPYSSAGKRRAGPTFYRI